MSGMPVVERAPHCRARAGQGPVDVLLGHSLYMALDPKQVERMRPFPPLGTLYAAAVLEQAGLRVALFDAMLAPGPEAFEAALDACRPRLVALYEDSFNFLSKMCLSSMRAAGLTMLASARARGLPVLVAGSDASDHPDPWLRAGASAVLAGEGEWSLVESAQRILGAPEPLGGLDARAAAATAVRLAGLPGLVLRGRDGRPLAGPRRLPEAWPDRLPPPDRALVDIEAYRRRWRAAHGRFSLNLAGSRGCPHACTWCARPIWGRRYAARSPEAVAEEIARLASEQAPDRLWFVDDVLGLQPGWIEGLAEALDRRGLRLPFQAQSRVDRIDERYAEALARAGCEELWLGVESGSQRVLDAMRKGIRVSEVAPATRRLRRQGVRVAFFLQLGYPGESWSDIEATAELLRRCRPDEIGVSVSYPLPGTPFYERVAEQLGPRRHWRDSGELAMLYQGPYRSDFYRALHRLLHREQDLRQTEDAERAAGMRPSAELRREAAEVARAWSAMRARERAERSPRPVLAEAATAREPDDGA